MPDAQTRIETLREVHDLASAVASTFGPLTAAGALAVASAIRDLIRAEEAPEKAKVA